MVNFGKKLKHKKMRILKIQTLNSVREESCIDRDYLMFHTCFQILVDWVEKEDGLNHSNYLSHKDSIDVLINLYDWWKSIEDYNSDFENSEESQAKLVLLINNRMFLWT